MTGNCQLEKSDGMEESTSLWVFGYGSLVWKPDFKPGKILVGSVREFACKLQVQTDLAPKHKFSLSQVVAGH